MQICIQNLTCKNIIGILPRERETLQRVIINAKITYPYDGENFIDYAALCDFIEKDLREEKYFLLEEAIQSLIQKIKILHPTNLLKYSFSNDPDEKDRFESKVFRFSISLVCSCTVPFH